MSLGDELKRQIAIIFRQSWSTRDGQKVPEPADVKLGNDAVKIDAAVLYADLDASTELVDDYYPSFAAKIYKSYLHCAAKIIKSESGTITAYDGDRIMATFKGNGKNTLAVRAALKINYAVQNIINPAIRAQYDTTYSVRQTVGIDTSPLFVVRTGIRGSNDLVWVGPAANYTAKLCDLSPDYPTRITDSVYKMLHKSVKVSGGQAMWKECNWAARPGRTIYRSTWLWQV